MTHAPSSDRTPEPPFPQQHHEKPGHEHELDPRPRYEAPDYSGSAKLKGKAALITGGDSGIGRAVAVLFAREGATVAFTHLPEEKEDAAETLEAIRREGAPGHAFEVDLREDGACENLVASSVEKLGRIDILVNNAAFQQHRGGIDDLDLDQWDKSFDTNIRAYFRLARAAVAHMNEGGAIVQTGSIVGMKGKGELLDYAATKGAIHAFTKALAQDLTPRGIRVNCVAPGPVWTPLNPAERPDEETVHFGEGTPYGRPAQPEEIAPAYVFFAADACSRFITGEVMTLLGGSTRAA